MLFTELFELIKKKFGENLLDDVIDDSKLANDGAYTAIGSYEFDELVRILVSLSKHTNIQIPDLLELYGEYLFDKLIKILPQFNTSTDILDFIEKVETHIHVEVRKLYPTAELPSFDIIYKDDSTLEFFYVSSRKLHYLAKGLLLGASKYFNEPISIDMNEDNERVLFKIKRI